MKKRRMLSILVSFVIGVSLVSCAMPDSNTASATKSNNSPVNSSKETLQVVMDIKYSCTDTAIRVNWAKSKDTNKYIVEMEIGEDNWESIGVTEKLTYRISDLEPDTTYKFRVTAVPTSKNKYEVEPSKPVTATTKPYEEKTYLDDDNESEDSNYSYNWERASQSRETATTTTKRVYTPQTTTLSPKFDPAYRYYYSYRNGTLYHDRNVSCGNGAKITEENIEWSKTPPSNYKPCPVCFPNE